MWKNVTITLISKVIIALSNLATVIVISRNLGEQGRGVCALYVVIIAISLIINEVLTGAVAGLVNLKYAAKNILHINFLWFVVPSVIVPLVFSFFQDLSRLEIVLLITASWLNASNSLNLHLFLGKARITLFNLVSTLGPSLTFLLCILWGSIESFSSLSYLIIINICWFFGWLVGITQIYQSEEGGEKPDNHRDLIRTSFRLAFKNQLASFFYITSSRFLYFMLDSRSLGVYSNAQSLSEATLMVPGSMGQMLYSQALNSKGSIKPFKSLYNYLRVNLVIFVMGALVVYVLPDGIYKWIFGPEFSGVKPFLQILIFGSLAYSVYLILSYWFSSFYKFEYNMIGVVCGFIVNMVITSFLLLSGNYSIKMAVVALSISQFVSAVIMIILFLRHRKTLLKSAA